MVLSTYPTFLSKMAEKVILEHQAESTKKAYAKCSTEYEQHREDKPHSEAVLLSFLVESSKTKAPTTLWSMFSLVKKYLLLECSFDVGRSSRIIDFLKTLSRQHKKKKAAAFSRDDLFKYLQGAPSVGDDLIHKLVLLVGFYGGLRGCEIVALTWEDLSFGKDGISIKIASSKTDRAGVGATKLLPKMDDETICPVIYFTKYRNLISNPTGRLFCQYRNGKFIKTPVGKNKISEIPKIIAAFLGLPNPSSYTGHALRVSSATVLADEGASSLALKPRHEKIS